MKILIVGAGGVGAYYGGRLQEVGADVFYLARGAHLKAMQENGLKLTSVNGDGPTQKVQAGEKPTGQYDVILHCTKTYSVDELMPLIENSLKPDGLIFHTQNGIDTREKLLKKYSEKQVAGCVVYGVVQLLGPGHVHNPTKVHRIIYGAYGEPTSTLKAFHELATQGNFESILSDQIEKEIWNKYLLICAFSGATTYYEQPIGPIMDKHRDYFIDCMKEIAAVARAKGIELPADIIDQQLALVAKLEKDSTSSMLRDFQDGKPIEVEALNGAVTRLGKTLNVPVPINSEIYESLKVRARQRSGSTS